MNAESVVRRIFMRRLAPFMTFAVLCVAPAHDLAFADELQDKSAADIIASVLRASDMQPEPFNARAKLESPHSTVLSAGLSGRLAELNARTGQAVKAGDVLFSFDCKALDATARRAAASVDAASVQAKADARLLELKAISGVETRLSASQLKRARAEVSIIVAEQAACTQKAPFDGTIGAVSARQHQHITLGEPVLELIDLLRLEARILVPSVALRDIDVGNRFVVKIDELGEPRDGVIERISPIVDSASQTVELIGRLLPPRSGSGASQARPGMSGPVTFQIVGLNAAIADLGQ